MDLREQIRSAIGGALAAQEGSDGAADAVMEVLAKQPTAAWCATDETGTAVEALGMNQSRRFDTALYFAPGARPTPSIPLEAIEKMLADVMAVAVSNGANSVSMPDEYVEVAVWSQGECPKQPAPSVPEGVSFINTSQLEGVVSTEIVHSYPPPSGWLRAIDEALVVTHLGVANASDAYEQAKAKLDSLIGFHVDAATDPAVNGGWKLVPIEPTEEMINKVIDERIDALISGEDHSMLDIYRAMLAAAPEAKK